MVDRGLENAYNSIQAYPDFLKSRSKMVEDMVIVHLTVLKPEINVIDVKYTLIDKSWQTLVEIMEFLQRSLAAPFWSY